mmetsp:Transcript_61809/g.174164  ORF Transcript_61809/g.174164 Transcript_61809/m.174164 type:complete len:232 (-) Transcript_61809:415-1110(-)
MQWIDKGHGHTHFPMLPVGRLGRQGLVVVVGPRQRRRRASTPHSRVPEVLVPEGVDQLDQPREDLVPEALGRVERRRAVRGAEGVRQLQRSREAPLRHPHPPAVVQRHGRRPQRPDQQAGVVRVSPRQPEAQVLHSERQHNAAPGLQGQDDRRGGADTEDRGRGDEAVDKGMEGSRCRRQREPRLRRVRRLLPERREPPGVQDPGPPEGPTLGPPRRGAREPRQGQRSLAW